MIFFARVLAFCSRSLDKSTLTVVRKTCGDSGLSGGKDGAETTRGSGVLMLRDPVAVCGLRGDDNVWAILRVGLGETTIVAALRACRQNGILALGFRCVVSDTLYPARGRELPPR